MRILIKITYALLGIVGIFLLLWFGMPEIRKTFQPVKMMSIVVKLDNQCTVADDTFIVTVPGTDLQFPFKNGIVRITKDKIEMIDSAALSKLGAIWESSILPKSIKLYKTKPGQGEFNKQMRRIAGHEFG